MSDKLFDNRRKTGRHMSPNREHQAFTDYITGTHTWARVCKLAKLPAAHDRSKTICRSGQNVFRNLHESVAVLRAFPATRESPDAADSIPTVMSNGAAAA